MRVLSFCYISGEKIFGLIQNEFEVHNIPWDNCLAMGSDNANVMVGKDKGVYGFMLRAHPSAYLSGCVCHLIHIAAEKGECVLNNICVCFVVCACTYDIYVQYVILLCFKKNNSGKSVSLSLSLSLSLSCERNF